ncbi:MAG: MFS transporter [Lacisediminihabitans sp.]
MPSEPSRTLAAAPLPGLFSRGYLWVTIGSCALVFLAAFESLAVTTVMPIVSADLSGANLYALAFAGPLATGVIGMVVAGNWCDRVGPVMPLYTSAVLFALGLIVAGVASTMPMLVSGRLLQGLGGGGTTVALYVVVARVYPARLHPSIFAGFAAAWVIPSLIGPLAAGVVAETWSWHWVFLGVVGLVAMATGMIVPALRGLERGPGDTPVAPWAGGRIVWSIIAAGCVLALGLLGDIPHVGGLLAVIAAVIAIIAVRPLLPRATLLSRRGLPSVILLRGLAAAAYFGAEVYLPYLLIDHYEFSAKLAGLALTLGAIAWAGSSWLQGRMTVSLSNATCTVAGCALVIVAIAIAYVTAQFSLPPLIAIVGWAVAGGGMGLMYPRMSTMTLSFSVPGNQGFNSSALTIADSLGGALALAVTGLVFATASFAGVFAFTAVIAVVALVIAPRVTTRD